MVGASIAGYAIKKEVGEGGTSAVYLAEHPNHGTVALKVLREKLRQDKTAVARFLREAKYGARYRSPSLVNVRARFGIEMLASRSVVSGDALAKEERFPTNESGLGAASNPICR